MNGPGFRPPNDMGSLGKKIFVRKLPINQQGAVQTQLPALNGSIHLNNLPISPKLQYIANKSHPVTTPMIGSRQHESEQKPQTAVPLQEKCLFIFGASNIDVPPDPSSKPSYPPGLTLSDPQSFYFSCEESQNESETDKIIEFSLSTLNQATERYEQLSESLEISSKDSDEILSDLQLVARELGKLCPGE